MRREFERNAVWLAIVGFGIMAGAAFIFVKVLVGELTPMDRSSCGPRSIAACSAGRSAPETRDARAWLSASMKA